MTAQDQANNAIKWIKSMRETKVATQWKYLGSSKLGYSIFGYGCKLLEVPYFPDEKRSEDFHKHVGLKNIDGQLRTQYVFKNVRYISLRHMNRDLSFRVISNKLRHHKLCYRFFERDVADLIVKHFQEIAYINRQKLIDA